MFERIPFRMRLHATEEALWAQLRRADPSAPAPAGSAVDVDAPHRAIVRRARELGAELVVLGPHRQRMVGDRLLGTTADRVIRGGEIARLAAEDGTDLLVLGTHGRGTLGRALAGSVGSEVARTAPCPVLLVPPRLWRRRRAPGAAPARDAAPR